MRAMSSPPKGVANNQNEFTIFLNRRGRKPSIKSLSEMSLSDGDRSRSRSGSRQNILLNGIEAISDKKGKSKSHNLRIKVKEEKERNRILESQFAALREEFKLLQTAYLNSINDSMETNKKRKIVDLPANRLSVANLPQSSAANQHQPQQSPPHQQQQQHQEHQHQEQQQQSAPLPESVMTHGQPCLFQLKKPFNNKKTTNDQHQPSDISAQPQVQPGPSGTSQPGSHTPVIVRPPPIKVTDLNIKATSELMQKLLGHKNFSFHHASPKDTFIRTANIADHKVIIDMLSKSNVEGHSFTPKEDRKVTLLLRNVCSSFDAQDIAAGIHEYEIDVKIYSIELSPFQLTSHGD